MHRLATPTSPWLANRRRGFSFTEVLFAVMILGVGFIMVAAIFPVAIQQARTSTEETVSAAASRGGANYFEKIATNNIMPATDNVVVGPDYDVDGDRLTVSTSLRGSLVLPSDPRVAWVPFYRRAGIPEPDKLATWAAYAQVIMVPVHVRNASQYVNPAGLNMAPGVIQTAKGGADITATIANGAAGGPDVIEFTKHPQVASEGAYVIIADARKGDPVGDAVIANDLHGRIYRLGNPDPNDPRVPPARWELMPGSDFEPLYYDLDNNPVTRYAGRTDGKERRVPQNDTSAEIYLRDIKVFVVGRGAGPGGIEGPAQDVAAYTTFVNVN